MTKNKGTGDNDNSLMTKKSRRTTHMRNPRDIKKRHRLEPIVLRFCLRRLLGVRIAHNFQQLMDEAVFAIGGFLVGYLLRLVPIDLVQISFNYNVRLINT